MSAAKSKPRLGRGLNSLISMNEHLHESGRMAGAHENTTGSPPNTPNEDAVNPSAPTTRAADAPASEIGRQDALTSMGPIYRTIPTPDNALPAELPLDLIQPNPHQPRHSWDADALAELAASIRASGVIQPIVVRRAGEGYELIAGERRLRAARLAGLKRIPVHIRDVSAASQAEMALVENIQRQDLNAIERAHGYQAILQTIGLTQHELADKLGEQRSSIANHLRLLELCPDAQDLIVAGKLTLGHAKVLASLPNLADQARLANLVGAQDMSVRRLEELVQVALTPVKEQKPAEAAKSAHVAELERSLSRQLGLRVQVQSGSKKSTGRVVLHYSSLDQFDELLNRLGVTVDD